MKKNEKYKQVGQYLDLGYFEWRKADKGYYWDREAIPGGVFIPKDDKALKVDTNKDQKIAGPFLLIKPESGYTWYEPLIDEPTLFLEFSELNPSENEIINFAERYGMLLKTGEVEVHTPRYVFFEGETPPWLKHGLGQYSITENKMSLGVYGESLNFWYREIKEIKRTIQIWHWLKEQDTEKLNLVITWIDKETVNYVFSTEEEIKTFHRKGFDAEYRYLEAGYLRSSTEPIVFSRFNYGDVFLPAQYLLQRTINKKLDEYPTVPRLLLDKKNKLIQYLVPNNLLAAMWFQFYQAVTGEKLFKRCEVCRKWEDVTNNKVTWSKHPECAGRERAANYRERKKEILNLCAEGKTIDEIAQITEVDIKQIKKWIEKERRV